MEGGSAPAKTDRCGARAVRPRRWLGPAVIAVVLGGELALAVQATARQDGQYGWGMFASVVDFQVRYDWVLADGRLRQHLPGGELRGRARQLVGHGGSTLYRQGAIRRFVSGYLGYLVEHRPPADAVAIRASLRHRVRGEQTWTPSLLERPLPRSSAHP
jgi:hypothetical protein